MVPASAIAFYARADLQDQRVGAGAVLQVMAVFLAAPEARAIAARWRCRDGPNPPPPGVRTVTISPGLSCVRPLGARYSPALRVSAAGAPNFPPRYPRGGFLIRVNALPVPFDGALYVNPVQEDQRG